MGELKPKTLEIRKEPITQKTLGGRVRVVWYSIVAVTPLRQLQLLMHQNVSAALQLGWLWLDGNELQTPLAGGSVFVYWVCAMTT